ncbi:MAG: leukotriene A4 hydrolase C-terminal domain-containing protein, partial [Gammaproteobacteria bacterium]|nr:leukotriene A4 hydrolase C-terminal domain-containing protein [Gammaproteobacteria bacterium]
PGIVSKQVVDQWVFGPGLPADYPQQPSDAFVKVSTQLQSWLKQDIALAALPTSEWSVHEWLHFINQLPRDLAPAQLAELDKAFSLSQSSNAEIFVAWSRLTIPLNYLPVMPHVEHFLLTVGRTKFVVPLYRLLLANPAQKSLAKQIYQQARAGYHPLTQSQIDKAFAE